MQRTSIMSVSVYEPVYNTRSLYSCTMNMFRWCVIVCIRNCIVNHRRHYIINTLSYCINTSVPCSGVSTPNEPPVVSDLDCNEHTLYYGHYVYGCTFSRSTDCSPSNTAAVECSKYCIMLYMLSQYIRLQL